MSKRRNNCASSASEEDVPAAATKYSNGSQAINDLGVLVAYHSRVGTRRELKKKLKKAKLRKEKLRLSQKLKLNEALIREDLFSLKCNAPTAELVFNSQGGVVIGLHAAQFSLAAVLALLESFPRLHDAPLTDLLSVANTAASWPQESFTKYAKGLCTWPLAKYIRHSELPKVPNSKNELVKLGFSGRVGRFLKSVLHGRMNARGLRLYWTWQKALPKACVPIPKSFKQENFRAHKERLTSYAKLEELVPCPVGMGNETRLLSSASTLPSERLLYSTYKMGVPLDSKVWEAKERIEQFIPFPESGNVVKDYDIVEFTRRLFRGVRTNWDEFKGPPHATACFQKTQAEGGTAAVLQSISKLHYVGLELREGLLRNLVANKSSVFEVTQEYWKHSSERQQTEVVLIEEPLKARPITKGNAYGNALSLIAQKTMWDCLYENFPQFSLLGKPEVTQEQLNFVQENSPGEFTHWVSGDYSAATDCLITEVTKTVFETFLEVAQPPEALKEVLREMLYEQYLWYPAEEVNENDFQDCEIVHKNGKKYYRILQKNGQLMGSPTSFPVLCIVNLIGYMKAWKRHFGELPPIAKLPVLVNGDDILFKANAAFYETWKREVTRLGFVPSVGKNFYSDKILTINSKLYYVKNASLSRIEYFPVAQVLPKTWRLRESGEARNLEKSQAGQKQEVATPVSCLSHLLDNTTQKKFSFGWYLHFNRNEVRRATRGGKYALFAHQRLGGLGISWHNELAKRHRPKFTWLQRRLASILHANPDLFLSQIVPGASTKGAKPLIGQLRTEWANATEGEEIEELPLCLSGIEVMNCKVSRKGPAIYRAFNVRKIMGKDLHPCKEMQEFHKYKRLVECPENSLAIELAKLVPICTWSEDEIRNKVRQVSAA